MYTLKPTTRFQKDVKLAAKRGYKIDLLTAVIKKLAAGEVLGASYKDHALKGKYMNCRECHITPDWLKCLYRYLSHYADLSDMPIS
jgi:mRNA interferase YafQ